MAAETQNFARLEARIPSEIYNLVKLAAEMDGLSITAFVNNSLRSVAESRIEKHNIIQLAKEDRVAIADAILKGTMPISPKLADAMQLHSDVVTESKY